MSEVYDEAPQGPDPTNLIHEGRTRRLKAGQAAALSRANLVEWHPLMNFWGILDGHSWDEVEDVLGPDTPDE